MIRLLRLLVVNPNTNVLVTERFVAEARLVAGAEASLSAVTGRFGASIVSTLAENVIAAHSALDLLAEHGGGCDAAILAISFDSALAAASEVMPVPVIGMTRAALEAALAVAPSIGLVTFGSVSLPLYRALARDYEMSGRVVSIEVIEVGGAADYLRDERRDEAVMAAIGRLQTAGAGAVVICGAAVVGIARRLQPRSDLPLFDGAAPAVRAAIAAARAGVSAPAFGRSLSPSTGLGHRLTALIEGRWPPSPTDMPPT